MKIFFGDRYILLLKPGELFEGPIILPGSREELLHTIQTFESDPDLDHLAISGREYKPLKRGVISCFTLVKAAGGMVKNERGEILFIHRRGKWDLPKGKVDEQFKILNSKSKVKRATNYKAKGGRRTVTMEWLQSEAVREVREETGLTRVEVVRKLKPTYHVFYTNGNRMLKKTWWFAMRAPGDQPLVPQTEEDILYVRWFSQEELGVVLGNTFGNLNAMIRNEEE